MKLIIEIPKKVYNKAITRGHYTIDIADYLKNGTPRPKGHGRLLDEDQLVSEIRDDIVGNFDNLEWWLSAADTVVEADKDGE